MDSCFRYMHNVNKHIVIASMLYFFLVMLNHKSAGYL